MFLLSPENHGFPEEYQPLISLDLGSRFLIFFGVLVSLGTAGELRGDRGKGCPSNFVFKVSFFSRKKKEDLIMILEV